MEVGSNNGSDGVETMSIRTMEIQVLEAGEIKMVLRRQESHYTQTASTLFDFKI